MEKCKSTLQQKVLLCRSVGATISSLFGILASLSFLFSCSALGLAEIVPGTDKSDAVCTKQKMAEQPEYGMCPHRAYLLESSTREEEYMFTRVFGWLDSFPTVDESMGSSRPRQSSCEILPLKPSSSRAHAQC